MGDEHKYNVFYNHFREFATDYSHLSPSEARAEMKDRKEAGEFLSDEDWRGYQDAIAAGNDHKHLDKITMMDAEQVRKWFLSKLKRGTRLSSNIWIAVHEIVAPYQEEYLIAEVQKIEPKKVASWVADRKHEGYFFTDEAYRVCRERFDLRKAKIKK